MSALKINPETLEHEGTVIMPGAAFETRSRESTISNKNLGGINFSLLSAGQLSDGQNIVFTDGEYINQIAACKDVSLTSLSLR